MPSLQLPPTSAVAFSKTLAATGVAGSSRHVDLLVDLVAYLPADRLQSREWR